MSENVCACKTCECIECKTDSKLDEIITELNSRPKRMYIIGTCIFVFGTLITFYFYWSIKYSTLEQMNYLTSKDTILVNMTEYIPKFVSTNEITIEPAKTTSEVNARLFYLAFRTTGLSALLTTLLYFIFKLSISFFDIGERTRKRINASKYLQFLYKKHGRSITKETTITELMNAFEIWNKTVESAFSDKKTVENNENKSK